MASLKDTILKTRQGLATASAEELAAMQGRAPSTQPLETSVLGGTPDQAKMAGTPVQKAAALRTGIQEEMDLATAVRRGAGARTEATAAEKAQMERAGKLQNLGSLDERVQQLAEQAIAQGAAQTQDIELAVNTGDAELDKLLTALRDDPKNPDLLLQVNNYLGYKDVNTQLSAEELLSKFDVKGAEAIGSAFAGSVADMITTGQLPLQEMGYQSPAELAALLGVEEQALAGMSIEQLTSTVNSLIQQEYSQVEELRARANDPRLGAAEQAEARQQLRELGAVGVRSAETDIDKLYDDIAEANTVEVFGEPVSTEKLLSDEYLSGVIANYLSGLDETTGVAISDFSKKLQESQPQLVDFIKKHQTVLEQAATEVEEGVKEFADTQSYNQGLASGAGKEPLDDEMMKEIFPDWGQSVAGRYVVEPDTFLGVLNDPQTTANQANQLVRTAKMIYEEYPEMWKEFATLGYDDLKALGALDDPGAFAKFQKKVQESKNIDGLETEDDLMRFLNMSSQDFYGIGDRLRMAENMGELPEGLKDAIPGLMEGNWDDVIAYIQTMKPKNIQDFLSNMDTFHKQLMDIRDGIGTITTLPGDLNKALINDGTISAEELRQYAGPDVSREDLELLLTDYPHFLDDSSQRMIEDKITNLIHADMDALIEQGFGVDNWNNMLDRVIMGAYEDIEGGDSAVSQMDGDIESLKAFLPKLAQFRQGPLGDKVVDQVEDTIKYQIEQLTKKKLDKVMQQALDDRNITDPYQKSETAGMYRTSTGGVQQDEVDKALGKERGEPVIYIHPKTGELMDSGSVGITIGGSEYVPLYGDEGLALVKKFENTKQVPSIIKEYEEYEKWLKSTTPGTAKIWTKKIPDIKKYLAAKAKMESDEAKGISYLEKDEYDKWRNEAMAEAKAIGREAGIKNESEKRLREALEIKQEEFFKEAGVSMEPLPPKEDVLTRALGGINDLSLGQISPPGKTSNTAENRQYILDKYYDTLKKYPTLRSALVSDPPLLTPRGFYSMLGSPTGPYSLASMEKKLSIASSGYDKDVEERTAAYEQWDNSMADTIEELLGGLSADVLAEVEAQETAEMQKQMENWGTPPTGFWSPFT